MTMERPTLGTLAKGDEVYVRRSYNARNHRGGDDAPIKAVVTSAARVWIKIESVQRDTFHPHLAAETWRMRRDTQDEGTLYPGNNASFVTPEQLAYDQRLNAARAVIHEHGLDIRRHGPSDNPEAIVRLADLLSTVLPQTEGLMQR